MNSIQKFTNQVIKQSLPQTQSNSCQRISILNFPSSRDSSVDYQRSAFHSHKNTPAENPYTEYGPIARINYQKLANMSGLKQLSDQKHPQVTSYRHINSKNIELCVGAKQHEPIFTKVEIGKSLRTKPKPDRTKR